MECQDSSVFLIRKLPLSITEALLKSMGWSIGWSMGWSAVRGVILVKLAERLTPEEKNR